MVVLFILAPEKTPQSMVPVEQREPTQVTRRVLLPDLKGRELTGAVSPSDLRTLGGRIENCMKRVFGFIVGDTVIIFGDDESFKDPSGVLGVEPSSFVRRSGEVIVNPKHSAVETNGDVTRLGTSITYSEVNAAVNTTEGEMLTSITKAYNNEQSEEGRRTLFDKGLDVGFTAAAKARSVLSPEDAERLGNVESKIRRGEALTKEEQSIARELFGHSNPEKLDSLIFYKISQFYRSMAEEISTTLKEKGRSSPEFRSIMKRLSEGGAFLNPLNLMAADKIGRAHV